MILLSFSMGVLCCALVLQGGELLHDWHERRRRIRVARARSIAVPVVE